MSERVGRAIAAIFLGYSAPFLIAHVLRMAV